jgi:hypothetical protein
MTPLIQIKPPEKAAIFYDDRDIPRVLQEQQLDQQKQILDALPSAESIRKEEAELAKKQRALDEKKQAKNAELDKAEALNRERNILLTELETAKLQYEGNQQVIADVKHTIREWIFLGRHPQMGKDMPPWKAADIASRASGAQLIVDLYPEFERSHKERLEQVEVELIAQAKKLGIVNLLTADLQARAKQ